MSIEEKCNGEVKQEVFSSNDGLLTYRRRKRMRMGGESSYPRGDAGISADEEVKSSFFLNFIAMFLTKTEILFSYESVLLFSVLI